MHLVHLGLAVRDVQRSQRFYATYFGFDPATARLYPDGTTIIRDAVGFDLALHPAQDLGRLPPFLHFGFRLGTPEAVRVLLTRIRADGITVVEHDDEPDYVAFKCVDPDGYRVETYWETEPGGTAAPRPPV